MAVCGRSSPTKQIMLECSVNGDISLVQSLMALDPNVLNSRNSHGLTSLHLSIIHEHFRLAEYLIHVGIDVTLSDNYQWTALHDASLFSSTTLVKILLEYGSDILAKNSHGELPIDVAGDDEIEALLCEKMVEAGHQEAANRYQCNGEPWVMKRVEAMATGFGLCSEPSVDDSKQKDSANCSSSMEENSSCSIDDFLPVSPPSNCSGYSWSMNLRKYSLNEPKEVRISSTYNKFIASNASNYRVEATYKRELSPLREVSIESISSLLSSPTRVTSPVPKRKLSVSCINTVATSKVTNNTSMFQEERVKKSNLSRSQSFDTIGLTSPNSTNRTIRTSARLNSELTRSSSDLSMHLKTDANSKKSNSSMSDRESPIELLKLRPRKPSLVDVTRRRSRDGENGAETSNRRSVSFQPEVLLQELVTEGDSIKLKEMITSGILEDVNKISPVGLTALHQCALDGNLECAKTLILNGADVNSMDVDGWSPLHAAAASGHIDSVRYLILSGAKPSLKNDLGQTPYDVAKKGIIRRMLFRAASGKNPDPSDDDISDEEFSSDDEEPEDCSHAGSDSEDEEEEINFSDSDINIPWPATTNQREVSPPVPHSETSTDSVFAEQLNNPSLIAAALLKDREMSDSTSSYGSMTEQDLYRHDIAELEDISETSSIRTLCDESNLTDTDRETDQGFSTMDAPSSDCCNRRILCSDDEGTSRDLLDIELEAGTYDYKFQEAVLTCNVEAVVKLIKHKAEIDVNRVNKTSGISALHHSVLEENFTLVQHLVCDFKCDINLRDIDGWTPLHAASAVGNIRIAQFLLENGAKASILNNNCEFPVDVSDEETMIALLKKAMLGPSVGKLFKGIFR